MEEFFHLWLGHRPTRLKLFSDANGKRDFDAVKETEAYGSGAASLVPYKALKGMIQEGRSAIGIADHFNVSSRLVEFRINVTRLRKRRN
jgi:Zn-dependent peptidase ImmA (M78 family)